MPRHAVVDLRDQFPDGGVELDQREELPIAQLRDDPTSRNLNRNLNFSFGKRRRLQGMQARPPKRCGSHIPSIHSAVTRSS